MRKIETIIDDIKKGENIDIYLTLVFSMGTSFYTIFFLDSNTDIKIINSLMLTVLSFIAYSEIGNRHKLDSLKSHITARQNILNSYPKKLFEDIKNADEIWLFGVHQSDLIIRCYSTFEEKINDKCKIRFLFIDPNGYASSMTSLRFPGKINPIQEKTRIKSSIELCCNLQATSNLVQIRVIDFLMPYGGIIINPNRKSGVIYIHRYTFRTMGGSQKPKFVYDSTDDFWYKLILTEVKNMWDIANEWDFKKTDKSI